MLNEPVIQGKKKIVMVTPSHNYRRDGPATWSGGREFEPRPGHTKNFLNGTYYLLVRCSAFKNGEGKLNTRSYQWTNLLPSLSLHSADVLPRVIETDERSAALLRHVGAGRTLSLTTPHITPHINLSWKSHSIRVGGRTHNIHIDPITAT